VRIETAEVIAADVALEEERNEVEPEPGVAIEDAVTARACAALVRSMMVATARGRSVDVDVSRDNA
jgi:hypothetical protein